MSESRGQRHRRGRRKDYVQDWDKRHSHQDQDALELRADLREQTEPEGAVVMATVRQRHRTEQACLIYLTQGHLFRPNSVTISATDHAMALTFLEYLRMFQFT